MRGDKPSSIQHHLTLHRISPEQGVRRVYSLMIERDLFGTVRLVRNGGADWHQRAGANRDPRRRDRGVARRLRRSPGRSAVAGIGICRTGMFTPAIDGLGDLFRRECRAGSSSARALAEGSRLPLARALHSKPHSKPGVAEGCLWNECNSDASTIVRS
jgi:hypothetical protein